MRSETVQAFVLSALDYGENDRIVSLFTLEHGRIRGVARGAKKSRKRFGSALELLARIELQIHCKEGLSTLEQAVTRSVYPGIRADLSRIALALYSAELLELLTPEGVPLPRLFRLFTAWLERLESSKGSQPETLADRRFFEINLLNILGYRPAIEHCSCCGEEYDHRGARVLSNGELACHSCARTGRNFSGEALSLMRLSLKTGSFGLIQPTGEALDENGRLLDEALAHHAGRTIKSLPFLHTIDHIGSMP